MKNLSLDIELKLIYNELFFTDTITNNLISDYE